MSLFLLDVAIVDFYRHTIAASVNRISSIQKFRTENSAICECVTLMFVGHRYILYSQIDQSSLAEHLNAWDDKAGHLDCTVRTLLYP